MTDHVDLGDPIEVCRSAMRRAASHLENIGFVAPEIRDERISMIASDLRRAIEWIDGPPAKGTTDDERIPF